MLTGYDLSPDAVLHPERRPVFEGEVPVIDWNFRRYSRDTAAFLSQASHLAYYNDEEIRSTLARIGMECGGIVSVESTHAYLAVGEAVATLAFRGTEPDDWEDIRTDGDFRLAPFMGTEAHSGFVAALELVWSKVDAVLDWIDRPVLLTGHSLGGALAMLAAARRAPAAVYTYGAPKVGGESFRDLVQEVPIFRLENCCDIVPNLPPDVLGYRHVGEQLFLADDRSLMTSPPMTRILKERSLAELRYTREMALIEADKLLNRWMVDHAIPNYTVAIRAAGEPGQG